MRKVLLTATVQSHIAQFHKPLIDMLHDNGYEVHVAAKNNLSEKNGLKLDTPDKIFDVPFERSPLSKKNILAFKKLNEIIEENKYDIIHCNTPMGGVITRLAAKKHRKKGTKVFYTAHGFHFYKGASIKNWLVYYPIEKWMARYTDKLITITKEDYDLARKKFKTSIYHINGVGADENRYRSITPEENMRFRKNMKYDEKFVILCTGELNRNKNQITIIRAINHLIKRHTNILLLLAGNGIEEQNLRNEIKRLQLDRYINLLGYRSDLEKYVNSCDLVVSASFREGLPLNIMEAMICGKPIIASYNRGHRELITDNKTGFLVDPKSHDDFANKIEFLMKNDSVYKEISKNASKNIIMYESQYVTSQLANVYFED